MEEKKNNKIIAVVVGTIGLAASLVALLQYIEDHPSVDLSGEWMMVNTVQKTSYRPYENLKLTYRLFLTQDGKSITGNGEKDRENGRYLKAKERSPIQLSGTISGDYVNLAVEEQGQLRKSTGMLTWSMNDGGDTLFGEFSHSAANSSGTSIAFRPSR